MAKVPAIIRVRSTAANLTLQVTTESTLVESIFIQAEADNSAPAYIGLSTMSTANFMAVLNASDSIELTMPQIGMELDNTFRLNKFFMLSTSSGIGIMVSRWVND